MNIKAITFLNKFHHPGNLMLVILFITLFLSTGCRNQQPNEPIPTGIAITIHITGLNVNDKASITAKSKSTNIGPKSVKKGDIPLHLVGESEDFVLSATADGYVVFPDQYQIKYIGKDIYVTNEDGTVSKNPTIYFIFTPVPTPSAKPANHTNIHALTYTFTPGPIPALHSPGLNLVPQASPDNLLRQAG